MSYAFISSFYNSKLGRSESIISGRSVGAQTETTEAEVKAYVDLYCPPEFRMVNGKDSLFIARVNKENLIGVLTNGSAANRAGNVSVKRTDASGRILDYFPRW